MHENDAKIFPMEDDWGDNMLPPHEIHMRICSRPDVALLENSVARSVISFSSKERVWCGVAESRLREFLRWSAEDDTEYATALFIMSEMIAVGLLDSKATNPFTHWYSCWLNDLLPQVIYPTKKLVKIITTHDKLELK